MAEWSRNEPGQAHHLNLDDDLRDAQEMLVEISHKWYSVGLQLKVKPSVLKRIRLQYSDPIEQLCEMLSEWLSGIDPYPTWEALAQALESRTVNEGRLAMKVRETFVKSVTTTYPAPVPPIQDLMTPDHKHHPPTQRPPPHAPFDPYTPPPVLHPVDQYAKYLRAYYRRKKLPDDLKWPPTASKKYIHLAVVKKDYVSKQQADKFTKATLHGNIEDIVREKESLDFSGIGKKKDGSPAQMILVEGGPGIGKTTFAWKVCRKWSKGKILQQYRLVVLLRLRDKRVREARNVYDLFYHSNLKLREAVATEMEAINGESVLLLYEGYDELPERLQTRESIFLEILHQECLPDASILITSRPSATPFLRDKFKKTIDQHIEILGFTKADVQSYAQSVIEDQQLHTEFTQYLKCYPHVRGLMYVPLNAVIVTEIYKTAKLNDSEEFVPTTLTELYTSLSRGMLLRYLKSHNKYGKRKWKLSSFSDLPEELHKQFHTICGIAFRGILKNEFIFDDLAHNFNTLDLMQSAPELYVDKGAVVSHNFFHLTLQEFLAAVHVSQQPTEEQLQYFLQSTPSVIEQRQRERRQQERRERERRQQEQREQERRQQERERERQQEQRERERQQQEQIKREREQEREHERPIEPHFADRRHKQPEIDQLLQQQQQSLIQHLDSTTESSTSSSKPLTSTLSEASTITPQQGGVVTHSRRKPLQLAKAAHLQPTEPYTQVRLQSSKQPWLQRHQLRVLMREPESTTEHFILEGLASPQPESPLPPIHLSQLQQVLETLRLQGLLPEPQPTEHTTSASEPPTIVLQLAERKPLPLQDTPQVPQTTPSLTTKDQGRTEPLQVPMTPRLTSETTPPQPESPGIPDTADIDRLQLETPQLEPPAPPLLLSQREIPTMTNPRPVIPHTLPISIPAGSLPYAVLTSSHFQNVVKFTAGLTKLKNLPIDSILLQGRGDEQVIPLYSLHWLFEAQCISKYSEMIGETTTLTFNHSGSMNPFDCFVLGFALSHINATWNIDIEGSHIGDEGLEMMVAGINYKEDTLPPSLKSISLNLGLCTISSVGLSHLKEMPEQVTTRITELNLWDNRDISEGVASLLSNLTSLKRLNLRETSISPQEVEQLADLLSHSRLHNLEYLNLWASLKSSESTSLILTALSHNTTLREIVLWEARVSENNLSLLTSALRTNTTLKKLGLVDCKINDNMMSEITSALCDNSTLQTLGLWNNAIGPRGATVLAEMLRSNKTLRELYVSGNSIGEEGTLKLATSLEHNTILQTLDLEDNAIGSRGATALAEMLRRNKTLRELNVYGNCIGEKGSINLATSLEHNETLEKLWINGTYQHSIPQELRLKTKNRIIFC